MTDDRMALIKLVEKDADLVRETLVFAEARQQHLPISNHTTQPSVVACPRNQPSAA